MKAYKRTLEIVFRLSFEWTIISLSQLELEIRLFLGGQMSRSHYIKSQQAVVYSIVV